MALTQIPAGMLDFDVATQAELDVVASVASAAQTAAAAKLSGDLVQSVSSFTGAVATGTTTIPLDDTIPQQTEGDQYLSVSITPTSAANILEIEVQMYLANSAAGFYMIAALFQDATANALAATAEYTNAANVPIIITLKYRMTAGTTSATTFKVRAGTSAAGTTTLNGASGARLFGGVANSGIVVRELKA